MSGLPPLPGRAERVVARSALVLAPHFDDEVLGCGGLLARLAADGAAVRVLFLSDGGGGAEAVADRRAYREARRDESRRAAQVLGLTGTDGLALPDGALALHLPELEERIRGALHTLRPELVLVPSPLEVTADHRAAFAALYRVLAPLRGDQELASLRVLLYEVNRPGHPDLLVDVSAQAGLLADAMACYSSQEERHPYWNAGLGLRRFRTLSLGPEVELAEGYRRLAAADFATRSAAQLIRHLGGVPEISEVREGPRVSVVVRTKDRPALLAEALGSLAAGAYRNVEVVLVNDGGAQPRPPDGFPFVVVPVSWPDNRGRARAAQAGVEAATGDYVAFLDDDDLAAPEHLATLCGLVAGAGVRVAYTDAAVGVYELSADAGDTGWHCRERRLPYSRDFDPDVLLVDNYIPFNTLLIERGLFAEVGPFDPSLAFFEDWDVTIRLAARTAFHHLAQVTCEYRHFRGGGHQIFGERPRERGDFLAVKARVLAKHAERLSPERLARAVDTLRAELVAEHEARSLREREARAAREELAALDRAHQDLARERFAWEERYHQAHGEAAAQAAELLRLKGDLQRLYDDESRLRATVDDQTAHLGRTYAEIERLSGLIRAMEATRAWRLHRFWQARLGKS